MRAIFVGAVLGAAVSAGAIELSVRDTASHPLIYASATDVAAALRQIAAGNGDSTVLYLDPYLVRAERRVATGTAPAAASVHKDEAELYYVIEGSATLVTGRSPDEPSGGTTQQIGKGDVLIIPENTPHWFSSVAEAISYVSMHMPRSSASSHKASTSRSSDAAAEAEVRRAQDDLIEAYLRRDVSALDRLLADEYAFVNDDAGGVADKRQILASFGSGGDRKVTSYRRQDDRVRVYGDVAVLTYRYRSTETYQGKDSSGDYRVTRILVKRDGRWQMVAGQETRLHSR